MVASILSRIAAIAILAIPIGYIGQEFNNRDRETMKTYSHAELMVYLESMHLPSHLVAILVVFVLGCGVTACIEVLAWLLRLPFGRSVSTA